MSTTAYAAPAMPSDDPVEADQNLELFYFALPHPNPVTFEPYTRPRYDASTPVERGLKLAFNHITSSLSRQLRMQRLQSKGLSFTELPLLSLPLDIILEVLGHTHPLDLYHMSMTSKDVRRLIASKAASAIWNLSFSRYAVPAPPPNASGWQWARLLFAPTMCDTCKTKIGLPIYAFGIRCCDPCRQSLFSVTTKNVRDSISETMNWTVRVPIHTHQYLWPSTHLYIYRHSEYESNALEIQQQKDTPGYEKFAAVRITHVQQIVQAHAAAVKWSQLMFLDLIGSRDRAMRKRIWRLKGRLLALGYDRVDVKNFILNEAMRVIIENRVVKINNRAWRTIQRDCKKTIRVLTDSRRRLERRHKSEKISYLYDEYCASLPAREWATLPSSLRIVEITDCVKLIDQAKMDDLTPEYLNPLFSRCISEWKVKQKKSIFPDSWEPFEEEHSLLPETSDLRKLDLAKATYTCGCFHYTNTSGRVDGMSLVGWEEVVAHRERHIDQYQELEFNHSGSRTVVEIINLLGLNEETTTPEQLDILDHRFLCECCLTRRNLSTRRAYSWRECVIHTTYLVHIRHHEIHRHPSWRLLSAEATQYVRANESPEPLDEWACNHCNKHHNAYVKLSEVVKHVKQDHKISYPSKGKDYIFQMGGPRRQRSKFTTFPSILNAPPSPPPNGSFGPTIATGGINNFETAGSTMSNQISDVVAYTPAHFRCNLCAEKLPNVIHMENQIVQHVQQEHSILEPVPSEHWKRIL